jgi:O-antigen/teichoic acid export membrane protein
MVENASGRQPIAGSGAQTLMNCVTPVPPPRREDDTQNAAPPGAVGADQPARSAGSGISHDDGRDKSLGALILRQTVHFAAIRTLTSLSTLITYVFLSRLLDRHAIGVFEIGQFYIGFGFLLGEGGLSAALVRSRETVRDHDYRVVLTSVLGIGVIIAVIYLLCTGWIARANHMSDVDLWVLRALTPLLLLQAVPIVPLSKLRRENRYDQVGWIQFVSTLGRHAAAIVGALSFGGPAALAAGALVQSGTKVWIAYRAAPGWVGLAWRWRTLRSFLPFGLKVQLATLLQYLRENIAAALLGPALGPESVAMFKQAATYTSVAADAIGGLARVQYRMYALYPPGSAELPRSILTALRSALLVGALILGPFAALAIWLIPGLYGQKWMPATPLVWGLIPHVLSDIAMQHMIVMVQGQGRPGRAALFYAIWSIATWITFSASLVLGDSDLAWVAFGQSVGSLFAAAVTLGWVAGYAGTSVVRGLVKPFCVIAISVTAAAGAHHALADSTSPVRGLVGAGAFLMAFAGATALIDRSAIVADLRGAARVFRRKR